MYNIPNPNKQYFARTNIQTIQQRAYLMQEFVPSVRSIAEICCGDCTRQFEIYKAELNLQRYQCLDIEMDIVAKNRRHGIECYCGDALNKNILQKFLTDDVIFFGPPLSVECDGHQILQFQQVNPSYQSFTSLLLGDLHYSGMLVCICPNTSTLGDIANLHRQIRNFCPKFNLPLIHYSWSTITGSGEATKARLKYIELWFSDTHEDTWEVRINNNFHS